MNIREQTRLIVRRGADFLVGTILYSTDLRWSDSPWDAWGTRNWGRAEMVARRVDGDLWLFNPVAGQLREVKHGHEN